MKAVITVVGKDRTGIIATVSAVLYKREVNILDISQTIMQGIFTMITLVDTSKCNVDFSILKDELDAIANELGVTVSIQNEEIFNSMHRI